MVPMARILVVGVVFIAAPYAFAELKPTRQPISANAAAETNLRIGFLNDLFYGRSHIAGPGRCQFPFLLGEKSTVVPVGSAGERSECARTGSLWSRSLGVRASGCVGLHWQAVFGFQIVWNKSTRRAAERGGARVGRPRWASILTMTGGSSIGARRRFHQDLEEPAYSPRALWQRLLGRPASESGTLRHGDGTHGRSARCRG